MDDPRRFPDAAAAPDDLARLHRLAEASQAAATGRDADARDAELGAALDALLQPGRGDALAALFATAPSVAVYRHLWRLLAVRERAGAPDPDNVVRLFAIPVVVVTGIEGSDVARATLPEALADASALVALLREHGALGGHQSIALSNALAGADALDLARLPDLLAWRTPGETARALPPAPIVVAAGAESVHLRFLVGSVVAAPGTDPLRDATVGRWGIPLAQWLARSLAAPGATVLALPRAPQPLSTALVQGRLAQREVSAQIFASNAIRKLRSATGEPTAMISVHRLDAPEGAGEVRLSLSSPFDPKAAEGFRCPLYPGDRVDDLVQMLTTLLAACRVSDVRLQPGIHGDRDPATGLTLLFKGEGVPLATLH
ncbi:MAG: hypothetical protein U1F15_04070 [Burkholderiales bacterium]